MLASSHESTRIGGLYLLRDVIIALPEVYWPSVTDSLFPFIRNSCAPLVQEFNRFIAMVDANDDPEEHSAWLDTTPPDVIVALRILGKGWPELKVSTQAYSLDGRTLRGLVLANVDLKALEFSGVNFNDVIMQGSTITATVLHNCTITAPATNTRLEACELDECDIFIRFSPHGPGDVALNVCTLRRTRVDGSQLSYLSITNCDIETASIVHPNTTYFDD